jgi:hypothetical protein
MPIPGRDGMPDVPWPAPTAELERTMLRRDFDPELSRTFLRNKRKVAATHLFPAPGERTRAFLELDRATPPKAGFDMPAPGGVGYGVFYRPDFKEDFLQGTALYWEIVFPAAAGGNVSGYLYLTACNRAARGVEALIAYKGQSGPAFYVYDWARPAQPEEIRWFGPLPPEQLAEYVHESTANGHPCATLPMTNMTYEAAPDQWVNQVWLLRQSTNSWESVYQFTYAAAREHQHHAWPGSWGPIVEGFQPRYEGTAVMGSLNALVRKGEDLAWGPWVPISPDLSDIREDSLGFTNMMLDANSSWIVNS